MSEVSRRKVLGMLGVAGVLSGVKKAQAVCSTIREEGRWRNLDNQANPAYLDVKTFGCDDTDSGEQTRYTLRCWSRLSDGKFFGREPVNAVYRVWNNKRWLVGKVYVGGYQDIVWMRAVDRGGEKHLHVLIKHKSLDRKPDAQSEFWYKRG
ncbi:MAG TPA: hypothetical protein VER03_14315 [Bryobacteraceae bacterium]|nr:hypothetical protein [Bryobacteraceae bacterium]